MGTPDYQRSIQTADLADESVTTPKVAPAAVTAAKAAADMATQAELDAHAALSKSSAHPGTLGAADLAAGAITGHGDVAEAATASKVPIRDAAGRVKAAQAGAAGDALVSPVPAAHAAADMATQAELDAHAALSKSSAHPGTLGAADLAAGAITGHGDVAEAATASKVPIRDAAGRVKAAQAGAAGDAVVSPVPAAHAAADMATQAELDAHKASGDHDARYSRMAAGSYVGDGGASRSVALAFRPKVVMLRRRGSNQFGIVTDAAGVDAEGGMGFNPATSNIVWLASTDVDVVAAGFDVKSGGTLNWNVNADTYDYIAFG